MGEVIHLHDITQRDLSAADILREIANEAPNHAFVVVWGKDGDLPTYHSTTGDMPTVLMRINEFIHKYYNGDFI
jgi:hypothetical protein